MHGWDPLIWVLLPVELFDLCRLDENHVTAAAAVLAPAAPPPVLTDAPTEFDGEEDPDESVTTVQARVVGGPRGGKRKR